MEIALMTSGHLGFIVFKKLLYSNVQIKAILTDSKSFSIIELAKRNNISMFIGNPRNGKALNFISTKIIDVLVSINYIFIIENDLISWPVKCAFNIHGSLLPKYRGRTPHVWAIINNETYTGITVHYITQGCDSGEILYQKKVPIRKHDTGASVLKKFSALYPKIILEVLKKISNNSLDPIDQDHTYATFFGRRSQDDGKIEWNWQKERIYNWVRAQAYPYPGAFTFYKDIKIIIDLVEFDDFGYSFDMNNGSILTINPLRVKTPNGVLRITKIRDSNVTFQTSFTFK